MHQSMAKTDRLQGIAEHERHKAAMIHYVDDNPRRAIMMKLHPGFFERRLHLVIKGMDRQGNDIERHYAAFGNLYLLRWARKAQVMCHRKARFGMLTDAEKATHGVTYDAVPDYVTKVPYEQMPITRTTAPSCRPTATAEAARRTVELAT